MNVKLDALPLTKRESAHTYLKQVFHFPDHYGKNLDALYDCLSEMEDGMVVEIDNYQVEMADTYIKKIIRVMRDAGIVVIYD